MGNLWQQISVYQRFENICEVWERLKIEQIDKTKEENCHHEIPKHDPLYLPLYSNGFN